MEPARPVYRRYKGLKEHPALLAADEIYEIAGASVHRKKSKKWSYVSGIQ